jgi:hypothetical protein
MKTIPFFSQVRMSAIIGGILLLCVTACNKQTEDLKDEDEDKNREKYIQRIAQYTAQDMSTASSTIMFEYTPGKKISKETLTRYTSNGPLISTYSYSYANGKISEVKYSESHTSYQTTTIYEYNGDRITGREIKYNNGNPDSYRHYSYNEDENYYEVRDGLNRDYWYLTDVGDLRILALNAISPTTHEYENTGKGALYAYRDDLNTARIMALSSKGFTVFPRKSTTTGSNTISFKNTFDDEGYIIESTTVGGTSYSKTIYTYD